MPAALTELTEVVTGLGTLAPTLDAALARRPVALRHVPDDVWDRLVATYHDGRHGDAFDAAFANGVALLWAEDGLRHRPPRLVEWRGHHRVPGDDHVPADLRIDHVYLVSCKYLSRILANCGPARLFDRLMAGEDRARADWFDVVAAQAYDAFYRAVRDELGGLPASIAELTAVDRQRIKQGLPRQLPDVLRPAWADLCVAVADGSARRWRAAMAGPRDAQRLLWRLLRIGDAAYFVLGADRSRSVRLRVASAWDWAQRYELADFEVRPGTRGQPEVAWSATVVDREARMPVDVCGHVEVRWSHGRFSGAPEAKVYLDVPLRSVPGYSDLR